MKRIRNAVSLFAVIALAITGIMASPNLAKVEARPITNLATNCLKEVDSSETNTSKNYKLSDGLLMVLCDGAKLIRYNQSGTIVGNKEFGDNERVNNVVVRDSGDIFVQTKVSYEYNGPDAAMYLEGVNENGARIESYPVFYNLDRVNLGEKKKVAFNNNDGGSYTTKPGQNIDAAYAGSGNNIVVVGNAFSETSPLDVRAISNSKDRRFVAILDSNFNVIYKAATDYYESETTGYSHNWLRILGTLNDGSVIAYKERRFKPQGSYRASQWYSNFSVVKIDASTHNQTDIYAFPGTYYCNYIPQTKCKMNARYYYNEGYVILQEAKDVFLVGGSTTDNIKVLIGTERGKYQSSYIKNAIFSFHRDGSHYSLMNVRSNNFVSPSAILEYQQYPLTNRGQVPYINYMVDNDRWSNSGGNTLCHSHVYVNEPSQYFDAVSNTNKPIVKSGAPICKSYVKGQDYQLAEYRELEYRSLLENGNILNVGTISYCKAAVFLNDGRTKECIRRVEVPFASEINSSGNVIGDYHEVISLPADGNSNSQNSSTPQVVTQTVTKTVVKEVPVAVIVPKVTVLKPATVKLKVGKKAITISWNKLTGKYQVDELTLQYRVHNKKAWVKKKIKANSAKYVLTKLKAKLRYDIKLVATKYTIINKKKTADSVDGVVTTSQKVK